jgi:hypothetical protein
MMLEIHMMGHEIGTSVSLRFSILERLEKAMWPNSHIASER